MTEEDRGDGGGGGVEGKFNIQEITYLNTKLRGNKCPLEVARAVCEKFLRGW